MKQGMRAAAGVTAVLFFVPLLASATNDGDPTKPASIYGLTMKSIDGKDVKLSTYEGGVLLIVNVASQ